MVLWGRWVICPRFHRQSVTDKVTCQVWGCFTGTSQEIIFVSRYQPRNTYICHEHNVTSTFGYTHAEYLKSNKIHQSSSQCRKETWLSEDCTYRQRDKRGVGAVRTINSVKWDVPFKQLCIFPLWKKVGFFSPSVLDSHCRPTFLLNSTCCCWARAGPSPCAFENH